MIFSKAIAVTPESAKELLPNSKGFSSKDINVEIDNFGNIFISGNSPIKFISLECTNTYFENALLTCSSWERGYGDLEWQNSDIDRIMPWYFAAISNNKVYCFGIKTGPNSLCSWQCGDGKIILTIDVRNGNNPIILKDRILNACTVTENEYDCDAFDALCDFCGKMCESPRLPSHPVYGGNDWYCNYGNNSIEKIIEHAERIVECSPKNGQKPYMVIDDGWEICHYDDGFGCGGRAYNGGPWQYCNRRFPDMKKTADEIAKVGAIPGIWIRPLLTVEKIPEECILKSEDMRKILDPSSEKALELIKKDISTLRNWGYKLIKHDFSTFDITGKWGFEMTDGVLKGELIFSDKTKTTAEIIKNFYIAIREAAGDDVLIMGCNTMNHLAAGIFELQRTGDDTSGRDWERTKKYGINTLAFHMPQHNHFYCADADCVGITNEVSWKKNKQWLDVLSKSGTALFVSIAHDAYNEEIKADLTKAFEKAAVNISPSHPIDWTTEKTPFSWESIYGSDKYEW